MSHAPSLRQIREAIEAHARSNMSDDVALESLRLDLVQMIESMRLAIERARDFGARGLISEAGSIIEDFPDLARQAEALTSFPSASMAVSRFWMQHVEGGAEPILLPTTEDVEMLAGLSERASRLRPMLDALRIAVHRHEPLANRLAILRKLREVDPHNRLWLDQIDALERDWIKRIGELRTDSRATREDLEEAFTALSARQWVAPVPRGLKDELYARLKPLRAEVAGDRYVELVPQIHDAAALMDRVELERLESQWAAVFHETGRMPDESIAATVAPAFDWLDRVEAEEHAQIAFEAEVDRLERLLDGRASVEDVDRQIAALSDSGRSAPEGVMARAYGYVQAARDRQRRRHRLILVATMLAAIGLAGALVFGIRTYSLAKERAGVVEAIEKRLDSGEIEQAHAFAEQIRAKPELHSVEVSAQLSRAEMMYREWQAERASLRQSLAALREELGGSPGRTRLKAILGELRALEERVDLADEKQALAELTLLHAEREKARDDADAQATDQALMIVDNELRTWPMPDRWSERDQVSTERWESYIDSLQRSKARLESVDGQIAGNDVQLARIRSRVDGILSRLAEASTRSSELKSALDGLETQRIAALATDESVFKKRIEQMLQVHGPILARLGMLRAYEESQRSITAWAAIARWRDLVEVSLRPVLDRQVNPANEAAALEGLRAFNAEFPNSIYREGVDGLIRRLDRGSDSPVWEREVVLETVTKPRYAGLEEVPFARGDRFLYRRPSQKDPDPMHRCVEDVNDLGTPDDQLSAYLPRKGDVFKGTTRPCEISETWERLQLALGKADFAEVQAVILDTLEKLRIERGGDPLFRLRALRDLASIFRQSGHVPIAIRKPMDEWLDRCSRLWTPLLSVDWAQVAHAPPTNVRQLRSDAAAAIAEFPSVMKIAQAAREERTRAVAALRPAYPIGVLLMSSDSGNRRTLIAWQPIRAVFAVIPSAGGDRVVELSVVDGSVEAPPQLPQGPILVFERK